ncbi:MAG: ribonuclease E/G, partial [Stellaceae bacterium]
MTRRLLLSFSPGEIWAALVADGELTELRLTRTHGVARAGDLYLGRVVAVRKEIPAVLIDIGEERPGFLGAEDTPRGTKLDNGQAVVVRVTKGARADKAAGLTMKLDAVEAAVAAPGPAPTRLRRRETPLAALLKEFTADEVVVDDGAALAEIRRQFNGPVRVHAETARLFEAEGVVLDDLLAPRVPLPKDGAITIEPTLAATMIDVDGGRGGAVVANIAAATEIARQIRLRDLAGPIVIDFIGMKERGQRARVEAALKAALGEGPQYPGWTRLGHYELVLTRRRPSLTELLFEHGAKTPLTVALEALRLIQRESRAAPGRHFGLAVHP